MEEPFRVPLVAALTSAILFVGDLEDVGIVWFLGIEG